MSVYGTRVKSEKSLHVINVAFDDVDEGKVTFKFTLPSNTIIEEFVMYNIQDEVKTASRIKFVFGKRSIVYKNLKTNEVHKADVHVWKGGRMVCEISGVVSRLVLYYRV